MKGVGCERPELKVEVAAGVREMGRRGREQMKMMIKKL